MPTNSTNPPFQTDEILWYDNGRWGKAGYALANPAGKVWTGNTEIFALHSLIGRNLFELMHRPDVRFHTPPHKQWWYDAHQMVTVGRKRLNDRTRMPNDSNGLESTHATPQIQVFIVYPVPYFGERIRQTDCRYLCQLCLMLLSEIQQHSDNERGAHFGPDFSGRVGKYMQEMLALIGMRYFGYKREEAYKPDFTLKDTDFSTYDPSKVLTSVEMTEERPPIQWWPTENDLSGIRGLPVNEALPFAKRWPPSALFDFADGNIVADEHNDGGQAKGKGEAEGFVSPPGQAP